MLLIKNNNNYDLFSIININNHCDLTTNNYNKIKNDK